MSQPFFYLEEFPDNPHEIILNEEVSGHIVKVLRMRKGEKLQLTDGKGNLLTAVITNDNKKKCLVSVLEKHKALSSTRKITIATSLLKNNNRFEWFLEKATEIGISEIIPLICERTEKQHFRFERMKNILISSMLQSQQAWLPELYHPAEFKEVVQNEHHQQKFIAHCIEEEKRFLGDLINDTLSSQIILVGPEGDFTEGEIQLAIEKHFIPVSLGETRLRSETAALIAASFLRLS